MICITMNRCQQTMKSFFMVFFRSNWNFFLHNFRRSPIYRPLFGNYSYSNATQHYFGRIWKCWAQQSLDILGFLCFIALLLQSFNQYSELMNYWSYFFVLDTFVVPLSSERIAVVHMFNTPKSYQLNHKTTELMVFNNSYEGMSNEHWGMTENLWFMLLKMDQTEWRMLDVSKQTVYFM